MPASTIVQAVALRDQAVRLAAPRDDGFNGAANTVDTGAQRALDVQGGRAFGFPALVVFLALVLSKPHVT